ncbi:cobalamin B12-binding domain-containing protein [Aestuariivita boseongensis]|uniref:cobalamin B12-binding domain-containing protein n=1 Tax=Aestuariivita boseongensis TaxID=1470562 RepID=UPI000681D8E2|nr:cobalamin B12-binding domain-containing protein [Aestuariivita boseongensis]
MTKGPKDPKANTPASPGQVLDRVAARRASQFVSVLPDVLPAASVSILAREVISRLAQRGSVAAGGASLASDLADALVSRDDGAGMRLTLRAIAAGTGVEDMYLIHLAGAARILGERWSTDALTSSQITIAAARIYALMRGISAGMLPEALPDGRHAIFATMPSEQHTLGITMAADLFRRDGWLIDLKVGRSHDELIAELEQSDFALVGLAATTPRVLPELVRLIAAIRVTQPHARIIVSGRLAEVEPRLQELTDADYVSSKLDTLRIVMRDLHDTIAAQPGAARG